MEYSDAWGKLHQAVLILTGPDSQEDRLIAAAGELLSITPADDLPKELQDKFSEFRRKITSHASSGDKGSIGATVNAFGEKERCWATEQIVSFFDTVCRNIGPQ